MRIAGRPVGNSQAVFDQPAVQILAGQAAGRHAAAVLVLLLHLAVNRPAANAAAQRLPNLLTCGMHAVVAPSGSCLARAHDIVMNSERSMRIIDVQNNDLRQVTAGIVAPLGIPAQLLALWGVQAIQPYFGSSHLHS